MGKRLVMTLLLVLITLNMQVNAESITNETNKNEQYISNGFFVRRDLTDDSALSNSKSVAARAAGTRYNFTYNFKNYVNVKVGMGLDKKSDYKVSLSTTTKGGVSNIYMKIYKGKTFGYGYLKKMTFSTDGTSTKTTTLEKGTYSFKLAKGDDSNKTKAVVGSGYMIYTPK